MMERKARPVAKEVSIFSLREFEVNLPYLEIPYNFEQV